MRIFSTVVFVLVTGILGSTVTPEDILNRIREKCEKNGGPTAFADSNYKDSAENFVGCVQSLVNVTQFEAEMAAARPNGKHNIVLQNYCSRVPTFKDCVKNIKDSIKLCLSPEERESIDLLYEATSSGLQFICDNGDAVKDFVAAGGIECVASKYSTVQWNCADPIFTSSDPVAPVIIPGFGVLGKLTLDRKGCERTEEFQRCSIEVLRGCGNSTPADVVNDGFNFAKDVEKCSTTVQNTLNSHDTGSLKKRSIQSVIAAAFDTADAATREALETISSSQALTASIVNVLSITAAVAMYLRFL